MCQGLGGGKKLVHADSSGGELDVIERVMGGMRWNFYQEDGLWGKNGRWRPVQRGLRSWLV